MSNKILAEIISRKKGVVFDENDFDASRTLFGNAVISATRAGMINARGSKYVKVMSPAESKSAVKSTIDYRNAGVSLSSDELESVLEHSRKKLMKKSEWIREAINEKLARDVL